MELASSVVWDIKFLATVHARLWLWVVLLQLPMAQEPGKCAKDVPLGIFWTKMVYVWCYKQVVLLGTLMDNAQVVYQGISLSGMGCVSGYLLDVLHWMRVAFVRPVMRVIFWT